MELHDISQVLAKKSAELEAIKNVELQKTNARLAELQQKEEARQRTVRDVQRAATAAAIKRRLEAHAAEEQTLKEVNEKRVLEEQVAAKRQAEIEQEEDKAEELAGVIIDQQHIEEQVRKTLGDARYSFRRTIGTEGEQIMPNPLARFLSKEPE
jgi:vancomycin resistance protein YoaR